MLWVRMRHKSHAAAIRCALGGVALWAVALNFTGCSRSAAPAAAAAAAPAAGSAADSAAIAPPHWGTLQHNVRAAGQIVPERSTVLLVPQLNQQFEQLTLAQIAVSGIHVTQGQEVAAFDRTQLQDAAADAHAQFLSFTSQVEQQQAQNAADAAKQAVELRKALADQGRARLELEKSPILSRIQIATDQVNLADATAHVDSLRAADAWLAKQAAAKLHALELQRDEQQMLWQRAEADSQRMVLRAPLAGTLSLVLPPYYGAAVPGIQLYSGVPLLRIFDPSRMQVQVRLSEVDLAWVPPNARAQVRIDAYPGLVLPAHLLRLNPIAISPLGTPIHEFTASFALDGSDPRVLPDLNASVEIASGRRAGWLVPRGEVSYQGGQAYIPTRGSGGQTQQRAVRVEAFSDQWIEVSAPWLPKSGEGKS